MNQLGLDANAGDANVAGYLAALAIRRTAAGREGHTIGGGTVPVAAPATPLAAPQAHRTIITGGNGGRTASTQKVKNEYLRGDDHFIIQESLFVPPADPARAVAAMVADRDVAATAADSPQRDLAIARYCIAQGFNADPNDWGWLADPANRCGIHVWSIDDPMNAEVTNRVCGLSPYTESVMAALNAPKAVDVVGRWGIWTTVLAISMRYFPSADQFRGGGAGGALAYLNTRGLVPEYVRSVNMPDLPHVNFMSEAYAIFFGDILDYTLWDGGRFGATHLGHDHTYKPNDANLNRVNKAIIETGRTLVNWPGDHSEVLNTPAHRQLNGRTLKHPLGLASTYAMFKIGAMTSTIPPALQIRYPVVPPRVQKIFIFIAGMDQMEVLKVGRELKEKRIEVYNRAVVVATEIKANAPAYSDLHELYGVADQLRPPEVLISNVTAILPVIYGYAQIYNIKETDADTEVAIGLALSTALENVNRDHPAMCQQMKTLFGNIYDQSVQGNPTEEILKLIG